MNGMERRKKEKRKTKRKVSTCQPAAVLGFKEQIERTILLAVPMIKDL